MNKKTILIILILLVLTSCNTTKKSNQEEVYYENPFVPLEKSLPSIQLDNNTYDIGEEIKVNINGAEKSDYVALFDLESEPCGSVPYKKIKVNGQEEVVFKLSELKLSAGDYAICLYQNKTFYLLDREEFQIDDDVTDYQIQKASAEVICSDKERSLTIKIYPSTAKELTYSGYWCNNGKRLSDYTALFRVKKGDALNGFEITFNENIVMPNEANEIEICVTEGKSSSRYLDIPVELKLPKSKYLYNFQVLTDIHANPDTRYGHWSSHFYHALLDIKTLAGNTSGIFTVGDNTDMGSTTHYDHLFSIIDSVFEDNVPQIYYTVGNHDYMYSSDSVGGFGRAIELFKTSTKMPNSYYSIDKNNTKYIFLSSDEKTVAGAMNDAQLAWFKNEMSKVDKNKFTFIFLHQPLEKTTAGTLPGQNWFGMDNVSQEIKSILKDYPNVVLFTGHTHYSLGCMKTVSFGHGENANFVNNASVAYLWTDLYEETVGGQCNFIEVYEDYIIIKGRDLFENKWVSNAQFICYLY